MRRSTCGQQSSQPCVAQDDDDDDDDDEDGDGGAHKGHTKAHKAEVGPALNYGCLSIAGTARCREQGAALLQILLSK